MKQIAWYDPTNGMVSTDKDSPLFTRLGQVRPLYPQPEQKPIGYASEGAAERLTTVKQVHEQIRSFRLFTHDVPLYTAPQRTWVGLTDGEVDKMILLMGFPPDWITENAIVKNIVRNLEAKLKEKNT